MSYLIRFFITTCIFFLSLFSQAQAENVRADLLIQNMSFKKGEAIRYLPVQDAGRIKPYDTFAREVLGVIYGKPYYKAESGDKAEAYLIVLTWLLSPDSWKDRALFEVTHLDVKRKLNLSEDQKYFTGEQLFSSDKFQNLMQELTDKRQSREKLTPYFQALQRLQNQMIYFREMSAGRLLKIMPSPQSDSWLSVSELPDEQQKLFIAMSQNVALFLGAVAQKENVSLASDKLDQSVIELQKSITQASTEKYNEAHKVEQEVFFTDAHFFRWSYALYILATIVLLVLWIKNSDKGLFFAWFLVVFGFLLHTLGFAYRIYLAERPPVTNMYETVIWVSWGSVLFAMILEKIYKFKAYLLAGALTGFVAMVIADMAPAVLDPSIQPLEAVLRSNYWLIVHVMTICISYAAFFLAFGLGDMGLIYYAIDANKYSDQIHKITTGVYRCIQIGVAFLTPGIILGGIWADYSWGRFWGWDPKETWALIALMGYIIVLHSRIVKWLTNFGMLVSAVVAFNLVIMAWYGVNYILGAGLHSYGFGAGGVEYVSIFVFIHLVFVSFVSFARKQQNA